MPQVQLERLALMEHREQLVLPGQCISVQQVQQELVSQSQELQDKLCILQLEEALQRHQTSF